MISSNGDSPSTSTSNLDRSRSTPAGAISSRTRTLCVTRVPRRRRLPPGGAALRRRPTPLAARCSPGPHTHTVPSGPASRATPEERAGVADRPRRSRRGEVLVRLEGAGGGDTALDRRAELRERELDGRQRGRDVEDVEPADVADAEHLPLQRALARSERDAVPIAQQQQQFAGVDTGGRADRADDAG